MALSTSPPVALGTGGEPRSADSASSDRAARWCVLAIGVLASACLVPWLGGSIFHDEGASLYSAHLSWSALWTQSRHVDLVFLPYYAFLHVWVSISGMIAWARLPSLAAYGITVVVIGRLGIRIAGTWCGIVASLLTATNTLFVEKALNVRPYALSAMAVTLAAAVLVRWLQDRRTSRLWLFSGLAVVATALQIFSLLAPAAMALAVLVARPRETRRRLRAMLVPVGTLAVLGIVWAAVTAGQVQQVNWIASSSTGALIANARGPAIGNLFDLALLVIAVAVVLLLAYKWWDGGRLVVTRLVNADRDVLALAVAWAAFPTVTLVVASFIHPIYWDRYVTASVSGLALAVAVVCAPVIAFVRTWGQQKEPGGSRRADLWLASLGVILFGLLAANFWMVASTVPEDLQGLAAYIARHARPGDQVILYDHSSTAAVGYYLARDGRSVALWPQVGLRQPLVEAFDLDTSPTVVARAPQRVWVVGEGADSATFTKDVLHRLYPWDTQIRFPGVTLSLLSRTSPNAPIPPPPQYTVVGRPLAGATLSGREKLYAASTPGARKVQFELTGHGYHHQVISGSVPVQFGFVPATVGREGTWNTKTVHNGTYYLRSVAFYQDGIVVASPSLRVTVHN